MIKRIVLVVCFGLLCAPFLLSAQDSIAVQDLEEEKQLKFQKYFFKALSEKSIKNYEKALENLEMCNEILPNDTSVFFEFSKNYFLQKKNVDAQFYINKALEKDPQNIWMLSHLVEIFKANRDYPSAIEVQKKIILQNPKKKEELVRLYYFNREYAEAISLMDELEKGPGLSRNLKSLKKSLQYRKGPALKKEVEDVKTMVANFEGGVKSFTSLKKLLETSLKEDVSVFHKYSEKAVDLFPAQPYAYMVRGKSLQIQNKLQQSIRILESGIDFVIDNPELEAQFYEIMAKAYDGLGNATKAQEFRNRAKKLKAVK